MEATPRPVPPRENCPDVEDCLADATEIGHVCTYGPICGTCIVYRPARSERGLLTGTCRLRPDRESFACTAPICPSYIPRAGAPLADGRPATSRDRLVALNAAVPGQAKSKSRGTSRQTHEKPTRVRVPDGPVGELEMTREELKALIREAMDEERGGAEVDLAQKWEGGTLVIQPADPSMQAKEIPIDQLLHKVVMVRDRLRVLEQKVNANPKLTDAEKVELQAYVTKCYGSLTTFNVLFRDRDDWFQGEKSTG